MEDEDLEEGDDVLYMEELESFNLVLSQVSLGAVLPFLYADGPPSLKKYLCSSAVGRDYWGHAQDTR